MRIQSPEMRHGRPERRQLELGRMQRIRQHPDQLLLAGDLAILIRNLHVTRAAQLVLGQTQVQVRLHGLGGAVEEAQGEGFGVDGRGLERDVEGGVKTDGEGLGGRVEELRLVHGEGSVFDDSLGDGRDAYFEAGGWSVHAMAMTRPEGSPGSTHKIGRKMARNTTDPTVYQIQKRIK